MRKKSLIFILLFAFIFMMADNHLPLFPAKEKARAAAAREDKKPIPQSIDSISVDSFVIDAPEEDGVIEEMEDSLIHLSDSVAPNNSPSKPAAIIDTTQMDSLQLAVYHHNKAIDDSIHLDSLNKQRKNGIEAPVIYSGEDSLIYDASSQTAYIYGSAKVEYQNMNLASDKIYMNLENDLVHATGSWSDTTMTELTGTPVFKMGGDTYENDTMAINFKTKKGIIQNVYTEQEDGYLWSKRAKRNSNGDFFIKNGRYTTCDEEHPDFYIALSRAKVRPGKDVVFGPAYLVVCDVPLPLAVPYGFFPFTKSYSSGFIMPTYGDESSRGFYLRNGGYYFAINDKWDLKALGEIYTKGSWGVTLTSNYRKRYRYSGTFNFTYQDTKSGDKGMPDFTERESFRLQWSHRQDAKANPFSSLSASVNFVTSSFEQNNLTSLYNPQSKTQSTRTSAVSYSTTFSSIGMSLSTNMNLTQNMRDSSISISVPDLNISISRFYPFKRKAAAGKEKWYEKIALSYTGHLSNSISTKEDKIMHSNLIKDWRNGINHNIPVSASFSVFDVINLTPSFNFYDRMYSNKIMKSWDKVAQREVSDTIYGFNNVYNWNMSLSANTKLYGFWVPNRKLFGDKIQAIRHVLTPSVSFTYAPNFGTSRYGYWTTYQRTDADGNVSLVEYSPYSSSLFGVPGKEKTGSISFDLGNNIEMKVKSDAEKDTTGFKKISIIDELGLNMSYNLAAKEKPWSDLSMRVRLKITKSYTFNLNAVFATYAYELDKDGKPYVGNRTEYSHGRFGRFQGMSQNFSLTLSPENFKKWFGKGDDSGSEKKTESDDDDAEELDYDVETNIDKDMERGKRAAKGKKGKAETDEDGYLSFSMPWSISIGYGISMRENTSATFNKKRMRYPYGFTQTLNLSGNVKLAEGWNISFSSGYDFEAHKISMTTASLARNLHCFGMSCSVVLAPYTSYNFSFRCNASTLTDALKYDKRSGYSNAVQWY